MEILMKDNLLNILTVPGTPIRYHNILFINYQIIRIVYYNVAYYNMGFVSVIQM